MRCGSRALALLELSEERALTETLESKDGHAGPQQNKTKRKLKAKFYRFYGNLKRMVEAKKLLELMDGP